MYQDFCERFLVGRSGRLLDMGCGLGFFLKAIVQYAAWEAYGCEISPVAVRYARDTLGLANVICSRLEEADLPPRSFDLITLWDVIDHIPQPDPLLRRCHVLLRAGGICFMRTPNIIIQLPRARLKQLLRRRQPGITYLQARDHAHHYSMSSIRRLLERNGFSRVQFVHLRPVQSVPSNKNGARCRAKNVCFEVVRALALVSRGHVNFDNLFVLAHKESQTHR
jgi:SAM-dependent methyltransferase